MVSVLRPVESKLLTAPTLRNSEFHDDLVDKYFTSIDEAKIINGDIQTFRNFVLSRFKIIENMLNQNLCNRETEVRARLAYRKCKYYREIADWDSCVTECVSAIAAVRKLNATDRATASKYLANIYVYQSDAACKLNNLNNALSAINSAISYSMLYFALKMEKNPAYLLKLYQKKLSLLKKLNRDTALTEKRMADLKQSDAKLERSAGINEFLRERKSTYVSPDEYKLANIKNAKGRSIGHLVEKIIPADAEQKSSLESIGSLVKKLRQLGADLTFTVGGLPRDLQTKRSIVKFKKNGTREIDVDIVTEANYSQILAAFKNTNCEIVPSFHVPGLFTVVIRDPIDPLKPVKHIQIMQSKYFAYEIDEKTKVKKYKYPDPLRADALSRCLTCNALYGDDEWNMYAPLQETIDAFALNADGNREVNVIDKTELYRINAGKTVVADSKKSPEQSSYEEDIRRLLKGLIAPCIYPDFTYSEKFLASVPAGLELLMNPSPEKARIVNFFLHDKVFSRSAIESHNIFYYLFNNLGSHFKPNVTDYLFPGLLETVRMSGQEYLLNHLVQKELFTSDIYAGFMYLQFQTQFTPDVIADDGKLIGLIENSLKSNPFYPVCFQDFLENIQMRKQRSGLCSSAEEKTPEQNRHQELVICFRAIIQKLGAVAYPIQYEPDDSHPPQYEPDDSPPPQVIPVSSYDYKKRFFPMAAVFKETETREYCSYLSPRRSGASD